MNQGSIADPSQTIKTHLREKTPAEKLAEHDAAATASNEKNGADSRPAEITEAEKEEAKPTTVGAVIIAALGEAIRWQGLGTDLRTVEVPEFLEKVASDAKVDVSLVVSADLVVPDYVEAMKNEIASLNEELDALKSGEPDESPTPKEEPEPPSETKPEEEASGEKDPEPSGSKPKTLPPSGPAAKKKVPAKKAAKKTAPNSGA